MLLYLCFYSFFGIERKKILFETDLKKEKEKSLSLQEQADSLQNNNKQLQKKLVTFYQNFDNELDQKIVEKVSTTRYKPQYEAIPIFRNFSEIPLHDGRFMRSVKENMRIRDFKARLSHYNRNRSYLSYNPYTMRMCGLPNERKTM